MKKIILFLLSVTTVFLLIACTEAPNVTFSFSSNEMVIDEDESLTVEYVISDEETLLSWRSMDPSIATVTNEGLVTGHKEGTTIIYVSFLEGKKEVPLTIKVEALPVIYTVTLEELDSFEVEKNQRLTLPTLEREGKRFIGWELDGTIISNELLVTRDATLTPVFETLVLDLSVSASALLVYVGETVELSVTQLPLDAETEPLVYESSDTTIATVDASGVVSFIASGDVDITVKTELSNLVEVISFDVSEVLDMVTVTLIDPITKEILDEVELLRGHRLNYTLDSDEQTIIGWTLEKTMVTSRLDATPFIYRDMTLEAIYSGNFSCDMVSNDVLITDSSISLSVRPSDNQYFECEYVDENGDFFAYIIHNAAELQALNLVSNAGVLVRDIMLPDPVSNMHQLPDGLGEVIQAIEDMYFQDETAPYDLERYVERKTNFIPLGMNYDFVYDGMLLGNGYSVDNLQIKVVDNNYDTVYIGLIGFFESSGLNEYHVISNLTLTNATVISHDEDGVLNGENIGGIASYVEGPHAIIYGLEVDSDSKIEGETDVGGVLGEIDGNARVVVSNLINRAQVKGRTDSGGVIGFIEDGTDEDGHIISYLYNYADITISDDYELYSVGGVIGEIQNDDHHISYLYNYGDVTNLNSESGYIGGVIGEVDSTDDLTFNYLYNYGNVETDADDVGGIIGRADDDDHVFNHLYNYGDISGDYEVGGIIGETDNGGDVFTNVSNFGDVTGNYQIGGLIGYMDDETTFNNVINEGNISGDYEIGGIVGFAYDPFDLIGVTNSGVIFGIGDRIGGIIGELRFNRSGTYTVSQVANTADVSGEDNIGGIFGYFYYYDEDTDEIFIFNNLLNTGTISGDDNVGGLFGYANIYHSTFTDLTNEGNVVINSYTPTDFGGIFGEFSGSRNIFTNITNYANVAGESDSGGFVGFMEISHSTFTAISNHGEITGLNNVGGLIGDFNGYDDNQFLNLSNHGDVTGHDDIGGIIGEYSSSAYNNQFENVINTGVVMSNTYDNDETFEYSRGDDVGGIIGLFSGYNTTLKSVTNTAMVLAYSEVGGIIGKTTSDSDSILFFDVYNSGSVTAVESNSGGIIGFHESSNTTMSAMTNTGSVDADTVAGGLIGLLNANTLFIDQSENQGEIFAETDFAAGAVAFVESFTVNAVIQSFTNTGSITTSGTKSDNIVSGDQTSPSEVTITP